MAKSFFSRAIFKSGEKRISFTIIDSGFPQTIAWLNEKFSFYLILCHYSFIVSQLFSRKYSSFSIQCYLLMKAKVASKHLAIG
ncbi:hypothetical protein A7K93_01015 [Candidatus Methylacidiphilum fumarolicum]|nr:hypothetical protein A7K93_01015 [Candidatus Methylacidiphilum fumarolicum]TFE76805.1 hypothetical protein A7D33_08445 [Candidatus Methylacidiphilum fumarolicum]